MKKTNPKSEQRKAARQLIVERFQELSDQQKQVLIDNNIIFTVDSHQISPRNTVLLLMQTEELGFIPTVIGGYRQWQEAGRQVKKGENSLFILVPSQTNAKDENGTVKLNESGEAIKNRRFKYACIFDISQTEVISEISENEQMAA